MRPLVFQLPNYQRGAGLMEAVVAMAIVVILMSSVLMGLSSSHISAGKNARQSITQNTARNQMEYVFEQPYLSPSTIYETIVPPEGFSVAVEALEYVAGDPNVETVRVTVYHQGKEVLVLETLRSNH